NKAYEFNGSSDFMVIPPLLKADSLRSLTISLWVKATNISRGTVIAFRLPGTMLCSSYMGFDNSGNGFNIHHQMIHNFSANSCTSSMIKDTIANPQNTWVHMVLVQQYYTQYSVGQYKYLQYINGRQLLGSNTPLRTDAQKTSFASGGTIGANNNSGNYQFNFTMFKGSIDDIRIYERALTEDEIKKLYEIKE
ncbi:MAG: LamG domain-containing protein, partial [Pedobacter sp.]